MRRFWALKTILIAASLLSTASAAAADSAPSGRALYEQSCAECHGSEGRGDGARARRLGFRVRDFTLGSFKCRCTPSGALPTDSDLERVVSNGLGGTAMPGFGDRLSAAEIDAVVDYVKSLVPAYRSEPAPDCLPMPQRPAVAEKAVHDGAQIYKALSCWSCHGAEGRGDGPAAKTLVDDWGDPIRARNFVVLKQFKCGGDPGDLYRTLHTGLDGTPMAAFADAFLFARGDLPVSDTLTAVYDDQAAADYSAWKERQPDAAALAPLDESDKRRLVEDRTWALVAFLESLL